MKKKYDSPQIDWVMFCYESMLLNDPLSGLTYGEVDPEEGGDVIKAW